MLAKQANDPRNPAQFIITTFHPQIIHETDKVYGVSHQNRISRCAQPVTNSMVCNISKAGQITDYLFPNTHTLFASNRPASLHVLVIVCLLYINLYQLPLTPIDSCYG